MGMNWTPDLIEIVKTLASKGLSAAQIAKEFGGVTRNAIVGVSHRNGVKLEYNGRYGAKPKPEGRAPRKRGTGLSFRANRVIPAKIIPLAPEPNARNLTILELKLDDCRYPVTGDHPFLFCGNPKSDAHPSYCAHHYPITTRRA